jgi:hypothetical protein
MRTVKWAYGEDNLPLLPLFVSARFLFISADLFDVVAAVRVV